MNYEKNKKGTTNQKKCPSCGATETIFNKGNGILVCHFCRYEFKELFDKIVDDLTQLRGEIIAQGLKDIETSIDEIITFKCDSCGAEVIIDTSEAFHARCHWCRSILSVKQQILNGATPDMVLPFAVTKQEAEEEISKFVKKRSFFALTGFKREFCLDNIMAIYLPYVIVDVNGYAKLSGQGEVLIRNAARGMYIADVYDIGRELELTIRDLTLVANYDKLDVKSATSTNNIINAILPFDVENAVNWNPNYLKGCVAERRDINIQELKPILEQKIAELIPFVVNETLTHYDRGVRWDQEEFTVRGKQWQSAYLPVWLYSFQEVKGKKKFIHYVALNARNKKIMGSVPINILKLLVISIILPLIVVLWLIVNNFYSSWFFPYWFYASLFFFFICIMFFCYQRDKYRNKDAKHEHIENNKTEIIKMHKWTDELNQRKEGLSRPFIKGVSNIYNPAKKRIVNPRELNGDMIILLVALFFFVIIFIMLIIFMVYGNL